MMDNVNQPPHYTQSKIECIDYQREVLGPEGFVAHCRGNVIKYMHRALEKGETAEQIAENFQKASVYCRFAAEAVFDNSELFQKKRTDK